MSSAIYSSVFFYCYVEILFEFVWLKDHHSPAHSPPPPTSSIHESVDWEPNALMEKMLRVQRDNAKKSEKIDFMEEHIQVLVAELKKKNRIVQAFFMKEDSGMMASEASDKHKVAASLWTVSFNTNW